MVALRSNEWLCWLLCVAQAVVYLTQHRTPTTPVVKQSGKTPQKQSNLTRYLPSPSGCVIRCANGFGTSMTAYRPSRRMSTGPRRGCGAQPIGAAVGVTASPKQETRTQPELLPCRTRLCAGPFHGQVTTVLALGQVRWGG